MSYSKLRFYGAAKEVTGSCHYLETQDKNTTGRILLDCGIFQGGNFEEEYRKNNGQFPFNPKGLNCAIITHGHADHSASAPRLIQYGFGKQIFTPLINQEILPITWKKSAEIQAKYYKIMKNRNKDNGRKSNGNGKGKADYPRKEKKIDGNGGGNGNHKNTSLIPAPYGKKEIDKAIEALHPKAYGNWFKIEGKIKGCFNNAAHILGSAGVTIKYPQENQVKTLHYTGDIGNNGKLSHLGDPMPPICPIDTLIIESTYGDRNHEKINKSLTTMRKEIEETIGRGGKVIIPAFALERSQEVLVVLKKIFERINDDRKKKLSEIISEIKKTTGSGPSDEDIRRIIKERKLGKFETNVYMDSPLALKMNAVYRTNLGEEQLGLLHIDQDTVDTTNPKNKILREMKNGTETLDKIYLNEEPCIVISSSGMCDHGPIRDHIKKSLGNDKNLILFVGFCTKNTLGNRIKTNKLRAKEDDRFVNISGIKHQIRSRIVSIDAFSSHADKTLLTRYVKSLNFNPEAKIFIVHGESSIQGSFRKHLLSVLNFRDDQIIIPEAGEGYNL